MWVTAGVIAAIGLLIGGPAQAVAKPRTVRTLESTISVLHQNVAELKSMNASHSAEYFFSVVTIMVAIAAALITIGALVATVMGYRMVRSYVTSEFSKRADAAFVEHSQPVVDQWLHDSQARLDEKLREMDKALAAELEQFRTATGSSA